MCCDVFMPNGLFGWENYKWLEYWLEFYLGSNRILFLLILALVDLTVAVALGGDFIKLYIWQRDLLFIEAFVSVQEL